MKKVSMHSAAVSKKQIRIKIQNSVNSVVQEFKIEEPSKKVKKQIQKASKKIAGGLANDLKRLLKKMKRAKTPKAVNGQKVKAGSAA